MEKFNLTTSARSLHAIVLWEQDKELLLDTPYQRGVVWGKKRQSSLIYSLAVGIPVPALVINNRFRGKWDNDLRYAVIDGKQRCTSILNFMSGKMKVPASWFDMKGKDVCWDEIDAEQRRYFRSKTIGICEGVLPDLETEKKVFDIINFGGLQQGEVDSDL